MSGNPHETKPALKGGKLFYDNRFSGKGLLALLALLFLFLCLVAFDFPRDDLHQLFFPLLFVCVWFLPSNREDRIPSVILGMCLVLWGLSFVGVKDWREKDILEPHSFVARLESDESGLFARGFYQRYNQIARTYSLPYVRILHLSFSDALEARTWLEGRKTAAFVVRGVKSWIQVVFPSNVVNILSAHPQWDSFKNRKELGSAVEVEIQGFSSKFQVVLEPELVSMPNDPLDLTLHQLAWIGQAVRSYREGSPAKVSWSEDWATRELALNEASLIHGLWKSKTGFSLVDFLKGTLNFFDFYNLDGISRSRCRNSVDHFYSAASEVRETEEPELYSAIFNNAGVVLLSCSENMEEVRKAESWFRLAVLAQANSDRSEVLRGASAALHNLSQLSAKK